MPLRLKWVRTEDCQRSTAGALASTVYKEEAQEEMRGPQLSLRVGLFG
jgi:hypothetical protein